MPSSKLFLKILDPLSLCLQDFCIRPKWKNNFFALNAPGAFHDTCTAERGGIYYKLISIYDRTGGKGIVDSAFFRCVLPF